MQKLTYPKFLNARDDRDLMITMGKKRTAPEEIPRYEDNDDVVVGINGISHSEGNIMEEDGIGKLSGGRKEGNQVMKPAAKILLILIFSFLAVLDFIFIWNDLLQPLFW
jgi:hypothetical protein